MRNTRLRGWSIRLARFGVAAALAITPALAQGGGDAPTERAVPREQIQQLALAVQQAEARVHASERELDNLKARLARLEAGLHDGAAPGPAATATASAPEAKRDAGGADLAASRSHSSAVQPDEAARARDEAEVQASEIATLDQAKVETSSKYPFQLNGLVLLTAGVNTAAVDSAVAPTASFFGPGSTALSLRQTVLGFHAFGPHLAGASSSADLRVDFAGGSAAGYNTAGGLIRLRTAHAALEWTHARAFFALDRPLLSPATPASLVQVAEPALAWSGNLWTWSPQAGVSAHFGDARQFVVEGAWIAPPDPPFPVPSAPPGGLTETLSAAERSRVPGGEARVAFASGDAARGFRLGMGGYVSPHTLREGGSFTAWAGTLDLRVPVSHWVDLNASVYRGQGLGGLGAGAYKDFFSAQVGSAFVFRSPEDVGGWAEATVHLRPALDWHGAFGMDNIFARQVRSFAGATQDYGNIARNRTVSTNLIWAPRAALLFSVEYRRLSTFPVIGRVWNTNVVAGAAGYRF